jgi:hypothetical protein
MQPVAREERDGEEDLNELAMQALSLTETTTRTDDGRSTSDSDSPDDEHPTQVELSDDPSASSAVPSRNIPTPSSGNGDGTRRYELTPGPIATENVMTPRNDVGPFVLDGGANRGSAGTGVGQQSLVGAANSS